MLNTMNQTALNMDEMAAVSGGDAFEGHLDEYDKRNIRLEVRDSLRNGIPMEEYIAFSKKLGLSDEAIAYMRQVYKQNGILCR